VNPRDYFDPINVSIHALTKHRAPRTNVASGVRSACALFDRNVVASHTPFDRAALTRRAEHGISNCECQWLIHWVLRRAWPSSQNQVSLANVAATFGIKYRAHDAGEDARCAVRSHREIFVMARQSLRRRIQSLVPIALLRPPDSSAKLRMSARTFHNSRARLRRKGILPFRVRHRDP